MKTPVFAIYEQQRVDQPANPPSLISTFFFRCLDSIMSLLIATCIVNKLYKGK